MLVTKQKNTVTDKELNKVADIISKWMEGEHAIFQSAVWVYKGIAFHMQIASTPYRLRKKNQRIWGKKFEPTKEKPTKKPVKKLSKKPIKKIPRSQLKSQ